MTSSWEKPVFIVWWLFFRVLLSTTTEFGDGPPSADIQESKWLSRSHNCLGVSLSAGAAIDDGAINAVREIMRRMAIVFRTALRASFERVIAEVLY